MIVIVLRILLISAVLFAIDSTQTSALRLDDGKPAHQAFPKPVILIDVGHGGIDGGTSHGDLLEKDINLEIGRRLYILLRSEGYGSILNRSGDYALSDENRWHRTKSRHLRDLSQRKGLSEEVKTALVISLHVNWSKNASRQGAIVLHQNEGRSALLANCIQEALNGATNSNWQSEIGKPFYLLNHIEAPAVIVETGFISNRQDRDFLISARGQTKIAKAITEAISRYFLES